jgi:hypothetical protein
MASLTRDSTGAASHERGSRRVKLFLIPCPPLKFLLLFFNKKFSRWRVSKNWTPKSLRRTKPAS